jgi:hypothetical protein
LPVEYHGYRYPLSIIRDIKNSFGGIRMNTNNKYAGRSLWLAALLLTSFITGCSSNNSDAPVAAAAPTVTENSPADSALAVALNSKVTTTFSEAMGGTTIDTTSFTVVGAGETAIIGTVSYDAASKTASFTHASGFTAGKVYTATLTSNVKNPAGTALAADHVWHFTSGTAADSVAPTVSSTNPTDGATGFALDRSVSANFSETLDPATVSTSTFTLSESVGGASVPGAVSYNNKVATFNPTDSLTASTGYTATLTTAITDLAEPANPLAANVEWGFETGDAVATGPAAINLRTAANFAIMTGTGVTSADGSAAITGNIGASGITGASITVACTELPGFEMFTDDATPVNGCVSADKGAAATALADVLTAYVAASAPATPAGVGPFLELGAGTVIAQTLVPGVYTWAGNVTITGEITLDGSATDVWIFQIDGTLDTDQAITLAGSALAKNVFWRVADAVTLGTGAQFTGIVLAKTKVDMIDTATIEGRLLAQTAVNLGSTTVVTQP